MLWPFGCPGGDVIVQGMLQALLNTLQFDMTLQEAVEAPRVSCFSFPDSFFPHSRVPDRIQVERRVDPAVREALRARGHDIYDWPAWEFDAGAVCMVRDLEPPSHGRRVLAAAADPRRISYALAR